jgi:hypothetical protein
MPSSATSTTRLVDAWRLLLGLLAKHTEVGSRYFTKTVDDVALGSGVCDPLSRVGSISLYLKLSDG